MKCLISFITVILFVASFSCTNTKEPEAEIQINAWYGNKQTFGKNGNPQRQINILVNIYTEKGPPPCNVSHAAIASRWPGHDRDSLQPNRKWYPVGATSEFRLTSDYNSCRWRIFDGAHFYAEQDSSFYRTIQPGTRYLMTHRVETVSENSTQYSVKLWQAEKPEPKNWDFQAIEINPNNKTGSALLIAHNTDVTFGNVRVLPVQQSK